MGTGIEIYKTKKTCILDQNKETEKDREREGKGGGGC